MRIGRIVIAIAALLLPAGTLAVTAVEGPAWAVTVGTGLEHCYGPVTGSIHYSPAWSDADSNQQIKAKIKVTFTGCSGGSPAASSFTAKGTLKFTPSASDNECTDAEDPGANGTLKLKYGGGIAPSTFSGEIWVPDPTGTDLEAESGNEVVTGSYANNGQTVAGVPEFYAGEVSADGNCTTGVRSVEIGGMGGAGQL